MIVVHVSSTLRYGHEDSGVKNSMKLLLKKCVMFRKRGSASMIPTQTHCKGSSYHSVHHERAIQVVNRIMSNFFVMLSNFMYSMVVIEKIQHTFYKVSIKKKMFVLLLKLNTQTATGI